METKATARKQCRRVKRRAHQQRDSTGGALQRAGWATPACRPTHSSIEGWRETHNTSDSAKLARCRALRAGTPGRGEGVQFASLIYRNARPSTRRAAEAAQVQLEEEERK